MCLAAVLDASKEFLGAVQASLSLCLPSGDFYDREGSFVYCFLGKTHSSTKMSGTSPCEGLMGSDTNTNLPIAS